MQAAEARPSRAIAGVVFVLVGTGFLLESLGAWQVDLVYLWPVMMIGVGISFMLGRARRRNQDESRSAKLAVAEERVRIARELHDIVAHGVSLMTIQIAAARRVAAKQPEQADQALANAEAAGRQSLTELRSLLAVLRSADDSLGEAAAAATKPLTAAEVWRNQRAVLAGATEPGSDDVATFAPAPGPPPVLEDAPTSPLPRMAQLDALVDNLRAAGLDATLTVTGELSADASPGIELAAYRVIQESLTNAVRHAPAGARVVVDVDYASDGIDIVVDDDGAGHTATRPTDDGHGLLGMRERVAAAGGTLEAGPRATGPGWRVHARFPLRVRVA